MLWSLKGGSSCAVVHCGELGEPSEFSGTKSQLRLESKSHRGNDVGHSSLAVTTPWLDLNKWTDRSVSEATGWHHCFALALCIERALVP